MQTSVFTTRLDTNIVWLIKQSASHENITQREFVEEAIRYFTLAKKRKTIEQSFQHIGLDQENMSLADTGFEELLSYY